MSDNRTPVEIWEQIAQTTDLPEPGINTDMDGHGVEGPAEPLPEGDGDRDQEGEF
jgi:hypothetical protein